MPPGAVYDVPRILAVPAIADGAGITLRGTRSYDMGSLRGDLHGNCRGRSTPLP
jgi:hypothetical protein